MSSNLPIFYKNTSINPLLDEKFSSVRRVLIDGQYWFVVLDAIKKLSKSKKPSDYWYRMKDREEAIKNLSISTDCRHSSFKTSKGNEYILECFNFRAMFRIIQSIKSEHAEEFKMWMATVCTERIEEEYNPDLIINRAVQKYKDLGFDEQTINIRMRGVSKRNFLTSNWSKSGAIGSDFGILTNIIMKESTDLTSSQYYQHKELNIDDHNLRDHMDHLELLVIEAAEIITLTMNKEKNSFGIKELSKNAKEGGSAAGRFRKDMERTLGRSIVSKKNRLEFVFKKSKKKKERRLLADKKKK